MLSREEIENMPQVELRVKSKDNPKGGGFVAAFRCLPIAVMAINGHPPEVVMWGERTFVFSHRHTRGREDLIYVEALAYPLISGATCDEIETDPTRD